MKKCVKRVGAVVLSAALALGMVVVSPSEAEAAAKPKKLTVTCSKKTLYIGGKKSAKTVQLKVKVTPKKASKKVTYKSSNKKVATVSKKGKVTAKKTGKVTITVTSKSNKKLKKKVKITVKKYKSGNTDTNSGIGTGTGTGNGDTSNATPTPGSGDTSNATPTPGNGDASNATPTPGTGNTSNATPTPGPTATPEPTPEPGPATGITLSKSKLTITKTGKEPNKTSTLTAEMTPANASSEVTWESADEGVATVADDGVVTAVGTGSTTITVSTDNGKTATCNVNVRKSTTAIHDPSIFKDPKSDNYYTVGTALGTAVSKDLQAWSGTNPSGASIFKNGLDELNELFEYTGAAKEVGKIWALDMIYNTAMEKYCMYVTCDTGAGYTYRTAIGMVAADEPTGPYEWQGMIVCADFKKNDIASTNIMDALGLSSADDIPSYYYDESEAAGGDSAYFKNNFPDCIDAAPFYDADGTLYMVYGSFTCYGGIRLLKLDPNTGLRNKDLNYEYEEGVSDPYFGKRLTNQAGEGPYILRVPSDKSPTGNYYFLWTSSGRLRGTGDYRMSMFRSEKADGPYVDVAGTKATDGGGSIMTYNYKYSFMDMAYTSMGGNSALRDEDGKLYLVYHNKFEDGSENPGTHMVKIHQMFLNDDGWLVAAPFEYHNETIKDTYSKENVVGDYEVVKHQVGTAVNVGLYNYNYSKAVRLNEDNTVTGAINGTWALEGNKITITEGNTTYKGVVCEQYEDDGKTGTVTSNDKTLVFTALGSNKVNIWGSKVTATDTEAVTYDIDKLTIQEEATANFTVSTRGLYGSDITWTSSDENVITVSDGTAAVKRGLEDASVKLTATVRRGEVSDTKEFTVKIPAIELVVSSVVRGDHIDLPKELLGNEITWASSKPDVIAVDGTVTQPESGTVKVKLTATIGSVTKEFDVIVMAAQVTEYIYESDYSDNTYPGWTSTNASDKFSILMDDAHGKYLQFAPGVQNSRAAEADFGVSDDIPEIYVTEFDLFLKAGNDQTTEFALSGSDEAWINSKTMNDGIASGYIFKMSATNSTNWTINGVEGVNIPASWVHVQAIVDTTNGVVTLIINDDETVYFERAVTIDGNGILKGMYFRGGRNNAVMQVANIKVYE